MLNVVQIQTVAIILVLSYFIGNFQSAVLFSKRFLHDDVRKHGSGNPGATNMTRVFGTKWGVITFLGDAFKCFLGVALGAYLGKWWGIVVQKAALDFALGAYIGGLGVVLGHCWPVLYRFKGGKGVACFFAFMFFS
ncbi:MAG: glycerol-3-phosphate acyltransferase, partial [Clostridia bacterium]|nr:glycerol-3-phosphate acyltransferase [Clostridia bacterium]